MATTDPKSMLFREDQPILDHLGHFGRAFKSSGKDHMKRQTLPCEVGNIMHTDFYEFISSGEDPSTDTRHVMQTEIDII